MNNKSISLENTHLKNSNLLIKKDKSTLAKVKIRNSSFELLRIILMIFIILSHIMYHTKSLPKLSSENYRTLIDNKYIFLRIISNYGKFGDIIFIMISGFFSIKRTTFHYVKFILIATQTYTYHYSLIFISNKLKILFKDVKLIKQRKGAMFFPLISINGHWFSQNYLLILIFMPFINTGLLNLSYQQYKILVILIIAFYCVIKGIISIYKISNEIFSVNPFLKLLLPYIIGGFIRIFDLKFKSFWKYSGIIFFILTIIMEVIFDKLALYFKNYLWIAYQSHLSLQLYSIFPIISSIGIVYIFKNIEIYNKYINFISSSVLGIYLIHANKNIAPFIYNAIYTTNDYKKKYFFFKYFIKAFIIFIASLLIDIIRRFTIGLFIENILKRINGKKK